MIYVIEGFKPMGITHTRLYPSKTHTHGTGMGFWWVWVWVEAWIPTGLPMSFTIHILRMAWINQAEICETAVGLPSVNSYNISLHIIFVPRFCDMFANELVERPLLLGRLNKLLLDSK